MIYAQYLKLSLSSPLRLILELLRRSVSSCCYLNLHLALLLLSVFETVIGVLEFVDFFFDLLKGIESIDFQPLAYSLTVSRHVVIAVQHKSPLASHRGPGRLFA